MKSEGKFYTFTTKSGLKTINIENIAAIEDINSQTVVTLNVKNKDGENIIFIADLPWPTVSADIISMSAEIWKR